MTTTAVHPEPPAAAAEGLAAELLARRRRKLPAITAALVLGVAVAAGVIGGVELEKHWGASTSSTAARAGGPAAGFAGLAGARGGAPGAGVGRFPGLGGTATGTSGTVTLIKGSDLYVTDATGNTVLVHTTAGSSVQKTVAGTIKSVHPGDSVTVTGSKSSDGSFGARQITIGGGNG